MSIKDLQKIRKEQVAATERSFIRHVVVGDDLFSFYLYWHLKQKHGPQNVGLLKTRAFEEADLFIHGPCALRGENNVKCLKQVLPEIEYHESEDIPQFYKEQKFRPFNGRSKSEALLWGEEFFTNKYYNFDQSHLFSQINNEDFIQALTNGPITIPLLSLRAIRPEDLIENAHWSLQLGNGSKLESEHLYWGRGPMNFLNLYAQKEHLSDDFIQACEETQGPASLYVKLLFERPISDEKSTLFLPLSYTHEWGHFIGEFKKSNENKQSIEFLAFIDKEHSNEEEISKKIRILKRNLEKIFPSFSQMTYQEFITFEDQSACLKIDDKLFEKTSKDTPNLHWAGVNAPLGDFDFPEKSFEDSFLGVSHFARGVLSLKKLGCFST